MRIISGTLKGRVLPKNQKLKARPTTDKAKESLFNILNFQIDYESIKVLDLFSGTGNISFEFASRGVMDITAVEFKYDHVKHIERVNALLETNVKIIKSEVFKFVDKTPEKFDLVFADPPFDLSNLKEILTVVEKSKIIKKGGLLIIEHGPHINFFDSQFLTKTKKYGKVNFSFFQF